MSEIRQGKNYNSNLTTKEIAERVRYYVKEKYPKFKFSVKLYHSEIVVNLLAGYISLYKEGADLDELATFSRPCTPEQKQASVDALRAPEGDRLCHINSILRGAVNPEIMHMADDVEEYINSYRYDDSDVMTDYFDTNFYFLGVKAGAFERPYQVDERLANKKSRFVQVA